MKTFNIILTREIEDVDQDSALEKFNYELVHALTDPEAINVVEIQPYESVNQKFIDQLKEFEYRFRDGMVFTNDQKEEITAICNQIIHLAGE